MEIELDRIYKGDCLELMRHIPSGSVDAVICDLPYGTTRNKWDSVIPFEPLWEQYLRVTKHNAAIVLFCQGMFTSRLMASQERLWRYNLVWDKCNTTGFLNANRMPLRQHEDIAVFYRALPTYNPQMVKSEPHRRKHGTGGLHHTNNCYDDYTPLPMVIADEKFPTSILKFQKNIVHHGRLHPTRKPVDLLRYLVRTYSNEGDTILDNCIGSGTTAIACIREHRHFIGFELDEKYFATATKRVEEERRNPRFF